MINSIYKISLYTKGERPELQDVFSPFFLQVFSLNIYSEEFELVSPNKIAKFRINISEKISYSVFYINNAIILDSPFSLEFA